MIDTHAHLHFVDAFSDIDEVLKRARKAGINAVINVGVNLEDSRRAISLVQDLALDVQKTGVRLYATAGLHPHEAGRGDEVLGEITTLIGQVVAIGECGLDYYRNKSSKQQQDRALRTQIEIALEHNLPLIFHVRDAWEDFFAVLRDYPKARGVIHSFTGYQREVDRALEHGANLLFGLNGIVTFTKDLSQLRAVASMPIDRIVFETDAPYLAPVPYRGKRNEPAYVRKSLDFIALLRSLDAGELTNQTNRNAVELFRVSL